VIKGVISGTLSFGGREGNRAISMKMEALGSKRGF
jgi:hypothetical protein